MKLPISRVLLTLLVLLVKVKATAQPRTTDALQPDSANGAQAGFDAGFEAQPNATFDPSRLTMNERSTASVNLTWSVVLGNQSHVSVSSSDTRILLVTSFNYTSSCCLGYSSMDDATSVTVQILAQRLGKASIIFNIGHQRNKSAEHKYSNELAEIPISDPLVEYPVVVLRNRGVQDQLLHITIQILLGILNFAFGCKLDMHVVWKYIKRPLGPSIGFCSQFILMPLVS